MSTFPKEDPSIGRRKFHRTAAGDLPLDWTAQALGAHVRITSGESPSKFLFRGSGTPFFKVEQLNSDSKYLATTPYFFAGPESVPAGSVVFPKRGASILLNKIRIFAADSYMDTNLMALTPISRVDSEFLYYALEHIQLWRFADTASIPQINNKHVKPLPIPFPREEEQRAIAAVLANADSLLMKTDALLLKKRDLKQAAMQQLLSGRRRLPGFKALWEKRSLGQCLLSPPDYGINAPAVPYSDRLPTYVRITDITDDGNFEPAPRVSVDTTEAGRYVLSTGDVVFARTGASVGKSYRYRPEDGPLVFAGFLIRVRPNPDVLLPSFLAAQASSERYWNWVRTESARSGQPGINGRQYSRFPVLIPPVKEQAAIAAILSDMDSEIADLAALRTKTLALKQALMQQLLTGRIRLI